MKRKIIVILSVILSVCVFMFTMTACGSKESSHTDGLTFQLINNNSEYEVIGYKGTSAEVSIGSTYNGKPVTSIGDCAFRNCDWITSVIIPDSITHIGEYAFGEYEYNECPSLIYNIKDGLKYLGSRNNPYLFLAGPVNLEKETATIEDSCKIIGSFAFDGAYLTNVTIGENITSISKGAFRGCSLLTSVTMGNNIKSIGNDAFSGCRSLTNVDIPNSVKSIGYTAFLGCSSLESITIPKNIIRIENRTFYGCRNLSEVVIPESVTSIGEKAFENCSKITKVNYLGTIDQWAQIEFSSNPLIYAQKLYIKDEVVSEAVLTTTSKISDYAFEFCRSLKRVVLGNSVKIIGCGAFSFCDSLTNVTVSDSLTSIGTMAFYGCDLLTNLVIPDSVVNIGTGTFVGCNSLNYTVKGGIKYFGSISNPYLFCVSATSTDIIKATIDENCKFIGDNAFEYCRYLEEVSIPSGIVSIGHSAFYNCNALDDITLSDELTFIGESAFYQCTSLHEIIIPSSVRYIGYEAFRGCNSLVIYCKASSEPTEWNTHWNKLGKDYDYYVPVVWGYTANNPNG